MQTIPFLNSFSLQKQIRLMTGASLVGMCIVVVFVMFSINQLRHEFEIFHSLQTTDKSLIEIKATALEMSRADPILLETPNRLAQADGKIRGLLQRISSLTADPVLRGKLDDMGKKWSAYEQGFKGAINIAQESPADALLIPDSVYGLYMSPMVKDLDGIVKLNMVAEGDSEQKINTVMSEILWWVILPMILLGIITTVTQSLFGHHLNKRLDGIVTEIGHLHSGDLTRQLSMNHNDEIGHLSGTINGFITRFDSILYEVYSSAKHTHKSANDVSQMAHSVTANAKEQSEKVNEVSSAIESMGSTIKEIAENATNASTAAKQTLTLVHSGTETGQSTIRSLDQIDQTVSASVSTMNELSTAIQRIGSVSNLIKDIADQTNLLALNAAIEAARAGDQGRGFAVVADEVRKLADRTTNATIDITKVVNVIEQQTLNASRGMATAKREVAQGVSHGEEMGRLLLQIENSVRFVTDMMNQIASATEVQSKTGERIWRTIDSVATISANTASNIEQARNEMKSLANLSRTLYETVGQFKLASAI